MSDAAAGPKDSSPGTTGSTVAPPPVKPVRKRLFRIGIIAITLAAAVWLVSYFMLAADQSGGMFGGFGAFVLCVLAFVSMWAVWLFFVVFALATNRRLGLVGWAILPLTLAIAWVPPWSKLFFEAQFKAAEPALRTYAQSCLNTPPSNLPPLGSTLGGFEFVSSSTSNGSVFLTQARSPDGEFGLVFCPSHALPKPPGWAVRNRYAPISADWWRYSWSNE